MPLVCGCSTRDAAVDATWCICCAKGAKYLRWIKTPSVQHVRRLLSHCGPDCRQRTSNWAPLSGMPFPDDFVDIVICNVRASFCPRRRAFPQDVDGTLAGGETRRVLFCRSARGSEWTSNRWRAMCSGLGTVRMVPVDQPMLLALSEGMNGNLIDPLKTTIVQDAALHDDLGGKKAKRQ